MKINKRQINRHKHREKTDKYYQSKLHKIRRKQVFDRDRGLCQEHLRQGKTKQLVFNTTKETRHLMAFADHIRPREAGGSDDLDNYQTLCKQCHDIKSNHDKQFYS